MLPVCGIFLKPFRIESVLKYFHKGSLTESNKLEDTARYAGLLLAPAEGFGRGFFALQDAPCIRRRGMKDNFVLFIHFPCILPFWKPWDRRR